MKFRMLLLISTMLFTTQVRAECYEDKDQFEGIKNYWCGMYGSGGNHLGKNTLGVAPIPFKKL